MYAYGNNNAGHVVGRAGSSSPQHAFAWLANIQSTSDLGGGASLSEGSEARGVNKYGYVAGSTGTGSGARALLWWPDGTRFQLPGLTPTSASRAYGINSRRWAVGTSTTAGGATHAVLWKVKTTYVQITDLQPGVMDNVIHLGAGGLLSVALLGSAGADFRELDPAVLTLGDERGGDTPIARTREGRPMYALEDVNRDGHPDLVAYFDQSALERNRDLTSHTTELVLAGDLGDGRHVRGTDRVAVR